MKVINLFLILSFFVIFSSGCADNSTDDLTKKLEFTTIEKAQNSEISKQRFVVVKDSKTWNELWSEHTKNVQPPPIVPLINFKEAMVLGVFLGERPNTCYRVMIDSVEKVAKKRLQVNYREEKNAGGVCGAAITEPFHLISLISMELPVEFIAIK